MLGGCAEKKIKEKELEYQRARQATIDSINLANKEQRRLDSLAAVSTVTEPVPVVRQNPDVPVKHNEKGRSHGHTASTSAPSPTPVTEHKTETGTPTTTTEKQPETANTTTATTEEEKKKKGLNNAAKGAIIGLGTGAAAGAVINKNNRGKGAVVGGVIGAIGGAVGGAVIDKHKEKKAKRDTTKTEEKK